MKIAFVTRLYTPLRAGVLEDAPLGGSESSLLLAARELARRGNQVTVIGEQVPHGTVWEGVRLLDRAMVGRKGLGGADAVVTLNRLLGPEQLEGLGPRRPLYVHWHQNDALSPYGMNFAEPAFAAHADVLVFVSHSQASAFIGTRQVAPRKVAVIPNPVAPPFCDLFSPGSPILAAKDPDLLVYASAPNRGLGLLLREVFPRLRAARPETRLEVFSGFQLDQGLDYASPDGARVTESIKALLKECGSTENVILRRGVPKRRLAEALRAAAMLCYPCTYRETCCVAALEAMAAGCQVSTTQIGALPETTAGFAWITEASAEREAGIGAAFAENTLRALAEREHDGEALEQRLKRQVDYVLRNHSPSAIGTLWERLLAGTESYRRELAVMTPRRNGTPP